MSRKVLVLAVSAVALLMLGGEPMIVEQGASAQTAVEPPNILVILTDDQDFASTNGMPKLKEHLITQGTRFVKAYATNPSCCPSRASFLRGQYPHNHGVTQNWTRSTPDEGWEVFRDLGREESTIATWLHDGGYTTGYVGKYLNGYGNEGLTTHIPPGWDSWWGWQGAYHQFGDTYRVNENGQIASYQHSELHDTDYMAQKAQTFIGEHEGAPWLLWVATNAPHNPAYAAERHQNLFRRTEMPKSPSFNEPDVSDKPAWVRSLPLLNGAQVGEAEEFWRQQKRSLRAVDDLVGSVVGKLEETGQLENTYIVFTSDNGYLLYKHRIRDKGAPYEEAIRLPFVVRGPGAQQGVSRSQLVANTDLAPTIADWTGIEPPEFVDGRSFDPLLSGEPPPWRKRLLIEYVRDHPFSELRASNSSTYTEYETGEREFYDLKADPYQLDNSYSVQDPLLISQLSTQLEALKGCAREACRVAEGP